MQITVIGRDNGNQGYENVLIYQLEVDNLEHDTVLAAYIEARADDLGDMDDDDKGAIEVLFAFGGHADTVVDWRD